MNKHRRFLFCAAVATLLAVQTHAGDLRLWFNAPGTNNMTQGLMLGNGRMGMIVPGNVTNESIVLNESSLWTGNTNLSGNYDTSSSGAGNMGYYQTFGNLILSLPSHKNAANYLRELNLSNAVARVTYQVGSTNYTREIFCSYPDQVAVIQLTSSAANACSGTLSYADGHSAASSSVTAGITSSGTLANGEQYAAQIAVQNSGGTVTSSGGVVSFTNCTSLTIFVALATDYVMDYSKSYHSGIAPATTVANQISSASAQSYSTLKSAHMADFQTYFNRLSINLGAQPSSRTNLPTDQRITANSADDDLDLEALLYQYGRYLMLSSSRSNGCPSNLQGLWNDSNTAPWHSDYHTDINIQMNYWGAEAANLSECTAPFFSYIQSQLIPWRWATTNAFGTRGWSVRTSLNLNGGMGWNWELPANDWMCMPVWEHFYYTGDTNFLQNCAYPLVKEICQFWQDRLTNYPGGVFISPQGWSPEHGPSAEDGTTYDQTLVWDAFDTCLNFSSILNTDAVYRATVQDLQNRLFKPRVGPWGELREWYYTADDPTDQHRHTSHLVGVYPGHQITPDGTPDLAAAAAVSLIARGDPGEVCEWQFVNRTAIWARLLNGEQAHHRLALLFSNPCLEPNLLCRYSDAGGGYTGVPQMDGSFGILGSISEMLLQSHEGKIVLLPALPSAWPYGSVTGLRARGGFSVDMAWTNSHLTSATIHSVSGTSCIVQYGGQTNQMNIPPGGSAQFTPQTITGRLTTNFNRSWKFVLGDPSGAQGVLFNDTTWTNIGLPHSFSLPYFLWTQFYSGYGWYRKHFTVPPEWAGRRVFIEFQAAFQDAQIYVNGTLVGSHKGGYNGFSVDVTSAAITGDNVVAVRLNNNWNAQLAPRAGDHTFSGGIYRDVNLVVTDPLHVTWYGTFVTTPTLAANSGAASTVNIQTEIANNNASAVSCTVQTDILDANSNVVATVSSAQTLPPGTTNIFNQTTSAVSNPLLWSPASPNLYHAVTTVFNGTTNVDTFNTTFGFRWFTWSATNGFTLNGSHLYFHGANVHQDHAGWGDGVADSALYRDVKMVKDAGFNFIRGSHYPKAPAFADACDQLGVCFWSENCFWGMGGNSGESGSWNTPADSYPNNAADQAPFENSVTNSLAEMIRIHRNHPSIIAWSMSNEPFFTSSGTMAKMRGLLTNEVALTHQLDPTRPAGIGGAQRPLDSTRIDFIGDVAGYNGDGATQSVFQNPGIPNLVNEYGVQGTSRPGTYEAGWGSLVLTNGFPIEYPWRSGQSIWCMFDHGSIGGTSLEIDGIVDYFRVPKREWYWYRNAYAGVPPPTWPTGGTPAALQLTASTTNLTACDGTQDALLLVTVVDASGNPLTNNVAVTLTVTSGPGEFPTGTNVTFLPSSSDPQSDITIRDGQAAIEFRTYWSGTSVITATASGLASTNLTITSQGSPVFVPGVTPPVAARPYSRYTGSSSGSSALTLALNRPTSASSTGSGISGNGNDGDTNTVWQAASTDSNAWWQVSLEATYAVNMVDITFPTSANYSYTISVSPDGSTWTKVVDQSQNSNTDQERRAVGNFGSSVNYVRVNFTNLPAGLIPALAEVSVGGAQTFAFKTNQLGGTIIGTLGSWNNSGDTREMAMDWDMTTFFDAPASTGGTNCWVGLDLGAGVSDAITQINYCPRSNIPSRMVGGYFQGANQPDFSDAVTLFTVTAQPATNVLTTQMITNQSLFRYVRYFAPTTGNGNVAEVEFYAIITPPAAPANFVATAGSGQVSLNWSASAGATSYNVKRSTTSGSGYVTVTNVAGTSFVNPGLANGTTYYFVVSATNTFGESANSAEVSATPGAGYATNYFWTGAASGTWDTATANWKTNGLAAVFRDGGTVVFDDTALSNTTVNLSATRTPSSVVVNNSSLAYTLSGSAIAGTGSLTKLGSGTLTLSGANTFGGGVTNDNGAIIVSASTVGVPGNVTNGPLGTGMLTMNGGAFSVDNGAIRTIANGIVIAAGTTNTFGSSTSGKNFNLAGALSGDGLLQNSSATPAASYSFFLLGDLSQFAGTMIYNGVTSGNGANWRLGASGSTVDLSHAAVVLNGGNGKNFGYTDNCSNVVLNLGSLSGNGYFQGSYNGGNGNVLCVGFLNTNATFSGQVGVANANMANFSVVKAGTGTQVLSGANIYTGSTTVSNGELVVSTAFTGGGNVNVNSGATFGVTNTASMSVSVANLNVAAGAGLEFQNIASLTTPLIAAGSVAVGETSTVKISGAAGLAAGNSYPLVSYAGALSGNFANLQLQMPYGWRGMLVNGANQILLANVAVVSIAAPLVSAAFSGQQLQLNWPADHTGWRLQAQTNSLNDGLSTNWVTVTSSSNTNQMTIPVSPAGGSVFYRLVYP